MGAIRQVLQRKGREVHTIGPEATVFEAIAKMVQHGIGALVVVDGDVSGILTERDYLNKIAVLGRSSRTTQVREIMTSPVACVGPEATVEQCLALMTDRRHRHLPVLDAERRLIGIVSLGDLVKQLIEEQKLQIEDLTDYIVAKYPR